MMVRQSSPLKINKFCKKQMGFPALLIVSLLFLTGMTQAANLKVRVIVDKANVRLKPDITSTPVGKVPVGAVLESEGKIGEWYRVTLPPDEYGITVSGYINESMVEIVEEIEKEKPPVVTQPVTREPVVREERPPRIEPQYIPKRAPKRNLAFSFYPSYGTVAMSDVNKLIDRWNLLGYEFGNLKEGLDLSLDGRFFLFPNLAFGFGIGRIGSKSDEKDLDISLKVSTIPLTLSGYYYFLPDSKISPYIGGGAGCLISSRMKYTENEYEGIYSGAGFEFHFVGGTEYFLFPSLSVGAEIGYRIAKINTIKVKESDFYGEGKDEVLMWDPSDSSDPWYWIWEAVSEDDVEYWEALGDKKLTLDFSGLSIKFKLSFYF
ncbi:MAG: outer membrane beta-barrel protein [Candidatus Aminicenantia bacterium]